MAWSTFHHGKMLTCRNVGVCNDNYKYNNICIIICTHIYIYIKNQKKIVVYLGIHDICAQYHYKHNTLKSKCALIIDTYIKCRCIKL